MRITKIAWAALLLLTAAPVLAADTGALQSECDSCHGPGGNSPWPDVPIIAGQTPEFLAKTLRAFQMWDRPCIKSKYRSGDTSRPETDMCKIAGKLSAEEVDALAAHYSQQAFQPAQQEFDPGLAAAGAALHEQYCETCHEQGGMSAGRGPRLAGQWKPYLKSTLKFVPTGEHLVPPMMERKLSEFTQEEISQLLDYYASQQN
jgi:sulfide dehydrogenase cytochrome subunit